MQIDQSHIGHMQSCLDLAAKARGNTSPNPMVGAVILDRNDELAGVGFHVKAGTDHAEVIALKQAGERSRGGALYVNLEPCNHLGKTPPCTEAIIRAGISKVIIGTADPNPKVNGTGIARLRSAGLEVKVGVLEDRCLELNRFFFHWIKTGLPWVTLKIAARLDGRIGKSSKSGWITGEVARARVQELRKIYDALLTGSGTILADDPRLTCHEDPILNPLRVVLDRRLQTIPSHQVYREQGQTLLYTSKKNLAEQSNFQPNVSLLEHPDRLEDILRSLAARNILSVLVEAGQTLTSELIENTFFQEVLFFLNPSCGGELQEKTFYQGRLRQLRICDCERLEEDLLLTLYPLD